MTVITGYVVINGMYLFIADGVLHTWTLVVQGSLVGTYRGRALIHLYAEGLYQGGFYFSTNECNL